MGFLPGIGVYSGVGVAGGATGSNRPLTLKHYRMFEMMSGAWGLKPGMIGEMGVGGEMNLMIASMAEAGGFDWGAGGMRLGMMNMSMVAGMGGMGNMGRGRVVIGEGGVNPNIPREPPRDGPVTQMGGPGVLIGPQWTGGQPNILACSSKNATSLPLSRKGAIVVFEKERPS